VHFRPSPSIRACLHALRPGQHLCLFYDRMEEQIGITIEFIRGGLEHGERCLYVSDSDTVAKLRETLHQSSLDAREALERRAPPRVAGAMRKQDEAIHPRIMAGSICIVAITA